MAAALRAAALLAALSAARGVAPPPFDLPAQPVWHPLNKTTRYALFRSPEFTVPAGAVSADLYITARLSPRTPPAAVAPERGQPGTKPLMGSSTLQGKLLANYKLAVNGVAVTAGPGHSTYFSIDAQPVNTVDLRPVLRTGAANVLAVGAFFDNSTLFASELPRVQAVLRFTAANGSVLADVVPTGPAWSAWAADGYFNPTGETGYNWYSLPNENLARAAYPLGWDAPGFEPGAAWVPAAVQPPFPGQLYLEPAPAPAMLGRHACAVTTLPSQEVCGVVPEAAPLTLRCSPPAGPGANSSRISSILFASYGTPLGGCTSAFSPANNFTLGNCSSANSSRVVEQLCLGQAACTITPSNALFGGDPCDKVPKRLAVVIACDGPSAAPPRYIVDFGQEFSGGVNISFAGPVAPGWNGSAGAAVEVILGEELAEDGSVMSPMRTGNKYDATWTLAPPAGGDWAAGGLNLGVTHHEMIQTRFAEVRGSPVPLTPDNARAWVVTHPIGGSGANPYEQACARSTPNLAAYTAGGLAPAPTAAPMASVSSSSPGLDATFAFTAYSVSASAVDINVDSRTRQRDLCHIDAFCTNGGQYATWAPGDVLLQRRTARNALGNDSNPLGSWQEFRSAGALMAWTDALETGDLGLVTEAYGADDDSITGPDGLLNSLQFYAGLRFWNASAGLMSYPASCSQSCGAGCLADCSTLADWPVQTRDGYDVGPDNTEGTILNGLTAYVLRGLADVAGWLGKPGDAARYTAMADTIRDTITARLVRWSNSTGPGANASQAFVVDGASGPATTHAAVHSTVYAAIAGVGEGDAQLAHGLAAYLIARNLGPSSSYTARWYVQALFQVGVYAAEAADFALELLSRTDYPSWGDMLLTQNASITLEAWRWTDKWNTDGGHPWSASPAMLIPRWLVGARPTAPGWAAWLLAPQPSSLSFVQAQLPTPAGMTAIRLDAALALPGGGNLTLSVTVPQGTAASVCLPPPGDAAAQAALAALGGDGLWLDGAPVAAPTTWGRFLCLPSPLAGGSSHTVQRRLFRSAA